MGGGAWEYMAACIEEQSKTDLSGFDKNTLATEIQKGYIDKYADGGTDSTWKNRILGDATGELGPFYYYYERNGSNYYHSRWYADEAGFANPKVPWFA